MWRRGEFMRTIQYTYAYRMGAMPFNSTCYWYYCMKAACSPSVKLVSESSSSGQSSHGKVVRNE